MKPSVAGGRVTSHIVTGGHRISDTGASRHREVSRSGTSYHCCPRHKSVSVWSLYAHGGQYMFSTVLVFTLKFEFYYYSKYRQPFSWRDRSRFEKASAQLPAPVPEEKGVSPQLSLLWSLFLRSCCSSGTSISCFSHRVGGLEPVRGEAPAAL